MGSAVATSLDEPREPEPAHPSDLIRMRDPQERWWVALPVAVSLGVIGAAWEMLFRPLWHDESWRAYHVTVTSGFFSTLKTANAPMGGGWLAVERASTAILGNTEWTLRLPSAISLVVLAVATYRLARWWLPPMWSSLTATFTVLNTSLVLYGLQLRPYLPDAACTAVVLCAWLSARDRRTNGRSTWGPYALVVISALISLPAVFLIGPLVLYDIVDAFRTKTLTVRSIGGQIVAAGLAGAHILFFVLPQSFLVHDPYWKPVALASSVSVNLHHLRTAIVSFPAGVVTAGYTSPDGSPYHFSVLEHAPLFGLRLAIGIGLVALWIVGALACTRRKGGPVLLVALIGSLLMTVVAATRNEWPIGFVRANLFLVPIFYVLGAIGLYTLVEAAKRHGIPARAAGAVVLVCCLVLGGTALWRLDQIHNSVNDQFSLTRMRAVVLDARKTAAPGDLYILMTRHADIVQWEKSWRYYAHLADHTRFEFGVPEADELGLNGPDTAQTHLFIASHAKPRHLFLVGYYSGLSTIKPEVDALGRLGFCPGEETKFGPHDALLAVLHPC